jgi:acyl carrier protein
VTVPLQSMTRAAQAAAPLGLDEVKRTLRRLIEVNAGIPGTEIDDESSVDDDLAMDSMSFLALQVAVEESFGINCTPDEILAAKYFAAIAALVHDRATRIGSGRAAASPCTRSTPHGMKVAARARKNAPAPRRVRP